MPRLRRWHHPDEMLHEVAPLATRLVPPIDVKVGVVPIEELERHPARFNSNKHTPAEVAGREPPLSIAESAALIRRTGYSRWSPLRPTEGEAWARLDGPTCALLHRAAEVGVQTGRLSALFEEELAPTIQRLDAAFAGIPGARDSGLFVRLEGGSLKEGVAGSNPIRSAREMITAIVTNYRSMMELARSVDGGCRLYLLPYRADMDKGREFRAFICRGKLTGISQYYYATDHGWSRRSDELARMAQQVAGLAARIVTRGEELHLNLPRSFVLDVFWSTAQRAELVELNSFGAQNTAGSALFHWIHDYDQLHGRKGGRVEVRVLGAR